MLTDLSIRNIAIIDTLHLSFRGGLTMLTGETGAGKSIIIDAVGLIMGGRATSDLIRTGHDEATVEAIFVYNAAMRDQMIPRKSLPNPVEEEKRRAPIAGIFPGAVTESAAEKQ